MLARGRVWSMSRPAGVSAQRHVGTGHVGVVGSGAVFVDCSLEIPGKDEWVASFLRGADRLRARSMPGNAPLGLVCRSQRRNGR